MNNYDDLLREKENEDLFNDNAMEKHWSALEAKMDGHTKKPAFRYRKMIRSIAAIAAMLVLVFVGYIFFSEKKQPTVETALVTAAQSAIRPPLKGADVPYEFFSFDAAAGDTLFTLNGSVIIFPINALLNDMGEIVKGNIEVRTREFNDVFDYSIAGIPMDYDSGGVQYKFISSAMIDISAFQNGKLLKVNPAAKPQLNLVSTNKELKTNLYKLDTVSGKWVYRGNEEITQLNPKTNNTAKPADVLAGEKVEDGINTSLPKQTSVNVPVIDVAFEDKMIKPQQEKILELPLPPQKASSKNPVISIEIDPASFKELMVYDGLKFEVIGTIESMTENKEGKDISQADAVAQDAAITWDNIELKRGQAYGTYIVSFSAKDRKAVYNVKPVLEGKDFEAAEKLYQQKMKDYAGIQTERVKREQDEKRSSALLEKDQELSRVKDSATLEVLLEENKKAEELNKLFARRNKLIEEENIRIAAINKENKRRWDSAVKADVEWAEKQRLTLEKQQQIWEQQNRTTALSQNLIRSFQIDGFGYWNCDQPTLPATIQYAGSFKTTKNEVVSYNTLCIATEGINRIQNYYNSQAIGLMPQYSYFGWAFTADKFYYFTRQDFQNAVITRFPNSISLTMNEYGGDVKNYSELKGFIFNVNNNSTQRPASLP
jgi:hypothetical protein